jgi:hypothetical protein
MIFAISCTNNQIPIVERGIITCPTGNDLVIVPILSGLADLPWSDVMLLVGALLVSASLATGFNILAKMFYRG